MKTQKVMVYDLLMNNVDNENYEEARVIVFDENYQILVSEMLKHVLLKTAIKMKNYELDHWNTDYQVTEDNKIKTLIIFAKKVS